MGQSIECDGKIKGIRFKELQNFTNGIESLPVNNTKWLQSSSRYNLTESHPVVNGDVLTRIDGARTHC